MKYRMREELARRTLLRRAVQYSCGAIVLVGVAELSSGCSAMERKSFDIRDFGARGDGVADDTSALQSALDAASGAVLDIPDGTYVLSRSISRRWSFHGTEVGVALLVEGHRGTTIRLGAAARFVLPTAGDRSATAFFLDNCEDVQITGVTGSGRADPLERERGSRALVSIQNSRRVGVTRAASSGLGHCVLAARSTDVVFEDCTSDSAGDMSGSSFALYSCLRSTIRRCTARVGTGDGDIVIFGGDSSQCAIEGCTALNSTEDGSRRGSPIAQGICVDSGARDCSVRNSTAEGYFYGIDVKTDVERIAVDDNVVRRCRVGIAVRDGEGDLPTSGVAIHANKVFPNGGNGASARLSGFEEPIGIYVSGRTSRNTVTENEVSDELATAGASSSVAVVVAPSVDGTNVGAATGTTTIRANRLTRTVVDAAAPARTTRGLLHLDGSALRGDDAQEFSVAENTLVADGAVSGDALLTVSRTPRCSLVGNVVRAAGSPAPLVQLRNVSGTVLTNNSLTAGERCVDVLDSTTLSITQNRMSGAGGAQSLVTLSGSSRVSITGNELSSTPVGSRVAYFVLADGSDRVTVTGNTGDLGDRAGDDPAVAGLGPDSVVGGNSFA